jgi:hypothetical protein
MEIEHKKSSGRSEKLHHWTDREVKDLHKQKGYAWRSNRKKFTVIPVTDDYRRNYDSIFGHI